MWFGGVGGRFDREAVGELEDEREEEGPAAGPASMSMWRKSSRLEPAEKTEAMGGSTIMVGREWAGSCTMG